MPSIAERIASTVHPRGCKLKTLRAVLHDIAPGPLDYALLGLIATGRCRMLNLWIEPVSIFGKPAAVERLSPLSGRSGASHPWRQFLAVQKDG